MSAQVARAGNLSNLPSSPLYVRASSEYNLISQLPDQHPYPFGYVSDTPKVRPSVLDLPTHPR